MNHPAFERILSLNASSEEVEATVQYLANRLKPIIRQGEKTLVCFPRENQTDFGAMTEKAVLQCGGQPIFWEKDLRWKELLRLAFVSKASTIIAPPLVILGLSKLAVFEGVPLYFYNAVLAGYPCLDWMMDGIEKGLDCKIWGVYGPGIDTVVSGFSCQCGRGIHLREDKFSVEIVDTDGNELPDGSYGEIVFSSVKEPDTRFFSKEYASVMTHRCPCGDPSLKLIGLDLGNSTQSTVLKLTEDLLYWNSILDCRIVKTEYGIDMEVVCFRGEKMPKLPSCAKLIVRAWNPDTDIPLSILS